MSVSRPSRKSLAEDWSFPKDCAETVNSKNTKHSRYYLKVKRFFKRLKDCSKFMVKNTCSRLRHLCDSPTPSELGDDYTSMVELKNLSSKV